ncbi:hypothetical protein A2U01_0033137, partial [Trifolium medium]|nr:hypothetical protein [Trifolium medium]
MRGVFSTLELGIQYYLLNNSIAEQLIKNVVVSGLGGGKATLSKDAHIPYGSHHSFSTITQPHNSHNSINAHILFHPVLVCGNQLNIQDMPSLWLPRSFSEYANSPWPQIVQLVDVAVWVAAVFDSCPKVTNGFTTTCSAYNMVPPMSVAEYLQMTPNGRHSKKWDPGGVAYFFISKK